MNIKRMLPWGITVIAATAALYCYNQTDSYKYDIGEVERQITETENKIAKYSELDKSFGIGSDSFYAAKPVLFLQAGGRAGTIPVYWEKADSNVTASSKHVPIQWGKWNGKWIDLTVTPPNDAGYYNIHFTNKINSDAFDVLVVVE